MPPPTKETALDLKVRRRIVKAVGENPGTHLRGLAELLDLPVSTLEYHCYHLVRLGHMTSRQDGGFKAFYPAEGMDRRDKDVLYLVRHDAPRRICTELLQKPGCTPKELRGPVGVSAPTLSFHLKKMRGAGLLREEPEGRTKRLYLEDPERVANVLVTYRKSFVDDAVDRFADAWLGLGAPKPKKADAPLPEHVPPAEPEKPPSVEDGWTDASDADAASPVVKDAGSEQVAEDAASEQVAEGDAPDSSSATPSGASPAELPAKPTESET